MSRTPFRYTCVLIFALSLSGESFAQWMPTGLQVATGSLFVRNSILYACTYHYGVMATADYGQTWTALNNGLIFPEVYTLADNSTYLFAGTSGGVFRSIDGQQWTLANFGVGNTVVQSLVASDTLVLAATRSLGVLASSDNGTSWIPSNAGLLNLSVTALAQVRDYIFAATQSGVFRSADNGLNWAYASEGITDTLIGALLAKDTMLFAGTNQGGVFRSTNLAVSWEPKNSGLDTGIGWIYVGSLSTDGTNLFAGAREPVYLSRDNGESWTNRSEGLPPNWNVTSVAVTGPYLFAAQFYGVSRRLHTEITDVGPELVGNPGMFQLEQNYPNPFNPTTTFSFDIPYSTFVILKVFDLLGREAATLVNERRDAGVHRVEFSGAGLPSGVYVYRMEAGEYARGRKMLLIK